MAEWTWQRRLMAASGYLELDMPEAAARELDHIPPEQRQNTEIVAMRLGIAMAARNWSLASDLARHLVTVQPDDAGWWINLAYSVRRCETLENAEAILLRALALHPQEVMVHFNLACYAAVSGRSSEAVERLKSAVALNPQVRQMALEDDDLKSLREIIPTL